MKSIKEIKQQFPILCEVLGEAYIEKLQSEQGALALRATINPFFKILFINDENDIEGLFSQAIEKNAVSLQRLKRFREEKNNVNLQNFINELVVLKPMLDNGRFLDESNDKTTPDFLGLINNQEIVFECVSVNESQKSQKQRNLDTLDNRKKFKQWQKKNPNGGVFSTFHENTPFDSIDIDKIIEKIKSKKSSRQVKGFKYKVMIMSFHNMSFLIKPHECLPNTSNIYDGIHSSIIYHSFYAKRGDLLFQSNSFEGSRHKIKRVISDGRFIRDSEYNLCILHFATNKDEKHKEFVFFENLNKPLPIKMVNELCDKFEPYETHSVLNKYVQGVS